MNQINLFFLVPGNLLGGSTSFVVHLHRMLTNAGWDPQIYRIGKVPAAGPKVKEFRYGLTITTISQDMANSLAASAPSLVAYAIWKKEKESVKQLMLEGARLVIHDPAEFHQDEMEFMKTTGHKPIVIRTRNVTGLAEHGVEAAYVPHPYVPVVTGPEGINKVYHAISIARIDFRKRSHWLIEANKLLPEGKHVHLYGEMNRIYEYHQMRKEHPDWRRWYHGEFPATEGIAVKLNHMADIAVDMTHIKGDGGGTQYTFFEAWDAGIPLILNRAWQVGPNDEVRHDDSCVMVDGVKELVHALQSPPSWFHHVLEGGKAILKAHSEPAVVDGWLDAMGAR